MRWRSRKRCRTCSDSESEDECRIAVVGRTIFFSGDVSPQSAFELKAKLAEFVPERKRTRSTAEAVWLYIASDGGDVFSGLSVHDYIKKIRADLPIFCVIDGLTASAATFIAIAGTKTYITPCSKVLIHQIRTYFPEGTHRELLYEVENCNDLAETIRSIYLQDTRIDRAALDGLLAGERYLGARECEAMGIATTLHH